MVWADWKYVQRVCASLHELEMVSREVLSLRWIGYSRERVLLADTLGYLD